MNQKVSIFALLKLLLFINNVSSLNEYDLSEPVYFVKVEAKGN